MAVVLVHIFQQTAFLNLWKEVTGNITESLGNREQGLREAGPSQPQRWWSQPQPLQLQSHDPRAIRELHVQDSEATILGSFLLSMTWIPGRKICMGQLVSGHAHLLFIDGPRFQPCQTVSRENCNIIRKGNGCWEAKNSRMSTTSIINDTFASRNV